METLEKEELDVTGHDVPSLDADRIDDATDAAIDDALDAAMAVAEPDTETQPEPEPQSESTPEPSVPAQEPIPTEAPQFEIDPEIASIEQPRNLSEKNQSNWRKLQETATTYKRQAEEAQALRQKLSEYEQKPPLPEDYQDLRQFRALFDIASDPEFQQKYDKPIYEATANIYSILKKHEAKDEVIQSIEAAGGPHKIDQNWWKEKVINQLPLTDAERVKRSLLDVVDLNEKKINEIKKQSLSVDDYFKQKDEVTRNWFQQQHDESIKYIQKRIADEKADWAMQKEIPKNASKEQIAQIESHNKQAAELETLFTSALFPQNPQERADVAAAAAMSHVLTNQLRNEQATRQQMQARLDLLEKENAKLKNSGKVPRQNSALQSSGARNTTLSDRLKMSSMDAIDAGLEEAGA